MSAVDETARDLLAAQAVAVNEQADDIEALAKRVEELVGFHDRLEKRVTKLESHVGHKLDQAASLRADLSARVREVEAFIWSVHAELAPKCPTCGKPH